MTIGEHARTHARNRATRSYGLYSHWKATAPLSTD